MLRILLVAIGLAVSQPVAPGAAETRIAEIAPSSLVAPIAASPRAENSGRLSRVVALKYD